MKNETFIYIMIVINITLVCMAFITKNTLYLVIEVYVLVITIIYFSSLNRSTIEQTKTQNKSNNSEVTKSTIDRIKEVYPDFDENNFKSMIKINFDKLSNKSVAIEESLNKIATEDFIKKYKSKLDFVKDINSDNVFSTSRSIEILDFDSETKQIKIAWTFNLILYQYGGNGEVIRGLTRSTRKSVDFLVIKAENVKFSEDIVHCPNCGAPLKYSYDLKCNHCKSTFDYSNYWLINDMIGE